MPHVFISYVSENLDAATRLRDALAAYGIEVWFDRDRIAPGSRWADAIREAISQGAFYIACFSEEYSKRSRTYMNEELIVAIEELRLRPYDRTWFIPVVMSKCEIPNRGIGAGETLRSFQWIDLSENWSEGVRRILAVIQPVSSKVDELVHALDEPSFEVIIKAIKDLTKIGSAARNAAPALLQKLEEEEGPLHADIIRALQSMEISDDKIVARIIAGCEKRPDQYWRRDGVATLIGMGEIAVPSLLTEYDNPHSNQHLVHHLIFRTLVAIGSSVVTHSVRALEDANDDAKHFMLKVIGAIGKPAHSALPAVLREMNCPDPRVRSAAVEALGGIADPSSVPLLISLLDDPSLLIRPTEQGTPAQALGSIGDPSAVPALIRFMHDSTQDSVHRASCATSLGAIRDPRAVAALVEVLEDEKNDPDLRINAASALKRIGEKSRPIVGRLQRVLLVAGNREVRYRTALTILDIGGDPKEVVPFLTQELRFAPPHRRRDIANVLRQIGRDAIVAVPEIINALDQENTVRDALMEALKTIDPEVDYTYSKTTDPFSHH